MALHRSYRITHAGQLRLCLAQQSFLFPLHSGDCFAHNRFYRRQNRNGCPKMAEYWPYDLSALRVLQAHISHYVIASTQYHEWSSQNNPAFTPIFFDCISSLYSSHKTTRPWNRINNPHTLFLFGCRKRTLQKNYGTPRNYRADILAILRQYLLGRTERLSEKQGHRLSGPRGRANRDRL